MKTLLQFLFYTCTIAGVSLGHKLTPSYPVAGIIIVGAAVALGIECYHQVMRAIEKREADKEMRKAEIKFFRHFKSNLLLEAHLHAVIAAWAEERDKPEQP